MPTPGNSINEPTAGITGFDGTATFTGSPATQYNVQVGGASTSTLASIAPSATSGIPLISQGAASNPAFGTAVVAGGGTGDTSFTTYTPICGGTTTTGVLQSVASIGTSGQVLTSNGAGALPTFQNVSAPGSDANAVVSLRDDFIGCLWPTQALHTMFSELLWTADGGNNGHGAWSTASGVSPITLAHPGVIGNGSATVVPYITYLYAISSVDDGSNLVNSIILGGGALTINWVFRIVTLSTSSNRYVLELGLGDATSNGTANDEANGCYFKYSDNLNSGNWDYVTAAASVRTTSTSSTAVGTGWHNAQITINAGATSVSFSMDGSSLGTANTTNIPTLAISPFFKISQSTTGVLAAGAILIDLMYLTQTLTTPR